MRFIVAINKDNTRYFKDKTDINIITYKYVSGPMYNLDSSLGLYERAIKLNHIATNITNNLNSLFIFLKT